MSIVDEILKEWSRSVPAFDNRTPVERVKEHTKDTFEFIREIGSGAFGSVWMVRHKLMNNRLIGLKTLHNPADLDGLCLHQTTLGCHPSFVPISHVAATDGTYYYAFPLADHIDVMTTGQIIEPHQYVPRTLLNEIDRRSSLGIRETARIGMLLLRGVSAMHKAGLVHCDIKPDNVLSLNGNWVLADLGLTTLSNNTSLPRGDHRFMPTDDARAHSRVRDLYAVGLTLIQCAMGVTTDSFLRHLRTDPNKYIMLEKDDDAQLRDILVRVLKEEFNESSQMLQAFSLLYSLAQEHHTSSEDEILKSHGSVFTFMTELALTLSGLHILIVEDDHHWAEYLAEHLRLIGAFPQICTNTKAVYSTLHSCSQSGIEFQFAIIDLMLPSETSTAAVVLRRNETEGITVSRIIHEANPNTKRVAMSHFLPTPTIGFDAAVSKRSAPNRRPPYELFVTLKSLMEAR